MTDRKGQQAEQPTPETPVHRALTAMADALATDNPTELLTNSGRVALTSRATVNEPAGTFDQVLLATASIELPIARNAYAVRLREIAVTR